MQKMVCVHCGTDVERLRVAFTIAYSTEVFVSAAGTYTAVMNSLSVISSSLDDENEVEGECIGCGETGVLSEMYHIVYACDNCGTSVDDPEMQQCLTNRNIYCDRCMDNRASSMCSWCDYNQDHDGSCVLNQLYHDRRIEREAEEQRLAEEQRQREYDKAEEDVNKVLKS